MKATLYSIGAAIAILLVYIINKNLNDDILTIGGFNLSLVGLIISIIGTILSGLSFINAKAAKIAATEAKEQIFKEKNNIELSHLHKQGTNALEKSQNLSGKLTEEDEKIFKEIELFTYKATELAHLILADRTEFERRMGYITSEISKYKSNIKSPGYYTQDEIKSRLNTQIARALQTISEQITKNLR